MTLMRKNRSESVSAILHFDNGNDEGKRDGDVDGNGSTDFGDILAILSKWGVCSEG